MASKLQKSVFVLRNLERQLNSRDVFMTTEGDKIPQKQTAQSRLHHTKRGIPSGGFTMINLPPVPSERGTQPSLLITTNKPLTSRPPNLPSGSPRPPSCTLASRQTRSTTP